MNHQAFNPYLPSYEYVPDAEPRIFGDRLYIYGSHDRFGGEEFCLNDYVCWSASPNDLGNWRCEGVIYRANQDPKNTDGSRHMNAPDCIQGPDGRYYLYYQLQMDVGVSVAVCDSPAGRYEFYDHVTKDGVPYGMSKGDPMGFDPGILSDNGRVWLYTGFSPQGQAKAMMSAAGIAVDGCYCVELLPDMKTVTGAPVLVIPGAEKAQGTDFQGHGFFEASSPRRIGDRYYMVYSSVLSHELCYAVSRRPNGGFTYGGTLVSIGGIGCQGQAHASNYTGNTHGGMIEINRQWYIFYHRQTNKQKCARQGCAEKITILPDGSVPQAEITSCGLNPTPLKGNGKYEARIACNLWSRKGTFKYEASFEEDPENIHPYFTQSGEDRDENPDQYIANMTDGSTAGFKYFEFDLPGRIIISARCNAEGTVKIRTEPDGEPIAVVSVTPCLDRQSFEGAVTAPVTGQQALYFTYSGNGSLDFYSFELD